MCSLLNFRTDVPPHRTIRLETINRCAAISNSKVNRTNIRLISGLSTCSMPIPSAANDVVDRWILGRPLELAANFLGACHGDGWVIMTPRRQLVDVSMEEPIHLCLHGWWAGRLEERLPLGSMFGRDKLNH